MCDVERKTIMELLKSQTITPCQALAGNMIHIWNRDLVVTPIFKTMTPDKYRTHKFYITESDASNDHCECEDCGIYCGISGGGVFCLYNLNCDEYKIKDILE